MTANLPITCSSILNQQSSIANPEVFVSSSIRGTTSRGDIKSPSAVWVARVTHPSRAGLTCTCGDSGAGKPAKYPPVPACPGLFGVLWGSFGYRLCGWQESPTLAEARLSWRHPCLRHWRRQASTSTRSTCTRFVGIGYQPHRAFEGSMLTQPPLVPVRLYPPVLCSFQGSLGIGPSVASAPRGAKEHT
jgi:hypothetical protein